MTITHFKPDLVLIPETSCAHHIYRGQCITKAEYLYNRPNITKKTVSDAIRTKQHLLQIGRLSYCPIQMQKLTP
jgi:hypothetical protein